MSERPLFRSMNVLALTLGGIVALLIAVVPMSQFAEADAVAAGAHDHAHGHDADDGHDHGHAEDDGHDHGAAEHDGHDHAEDDALAEEAAAEKPEGDACCSTLAKKDAPAGAPSALTLEAEAKEMCGEHRVPEAQCGICQPDLAAGLQPGQGLWVRLASNEAAVNSGVEARAADTAGTGLRGAWLGRVIYDPARTVELRAPLAGQVTAVTVALGETVKLGQVLARIAAPELTTLQGAAREAEAQLTLAQQTVDRETGLHAKGISSTAELQQAQAERQRASAATSAAREQLARYGADGAQGEVVLVAPFDATVVARHITPGQQVDATTDCLDLADTNATLIEFSVPTADSARVALGQTVQTQVDDLAGITLEATVNWIAPTVDAATRTVRVRASAPNPGGVLREGMLARAALAAQGDAGLQVPVAALQQVDGLPFVFVQHAPDLFEARRVETAARSGEQVGIQAGLEAGERIAVARAFVVKSEFMRARMGAGCTDH
jgi:cobalt-zinc-cadmium efflux system membrane fusion protein